MVAYEWEATVWTLAWKALKMSGRPRIFISDSSLWAKRPDRVVVAAGPQQLPIG